MKITVLGSGSTGNAVLICTEKTKVLVDIGLSAKETLRRLALVGVACDDLELKRKFINYDTGNRASIVAGPR
jgi:phosphoribosyl 1,2-cyclic phosphodiesterase